MWRRRKLLDASTAPAPAPCCYYLCVTNVVKLGWRADATIYRYCSEYNQYGSNLAGQRHCWRRLNGWNNFYCRSVYGPNYDSKSRFCDGNGGLTGRFHKIGYCESHDSVYKCQPPRTLRLFFWWFQFRRTVFLGR